MSREADLIDHAIEAGKLTVCPPMPAAGDLKLPKKKRKGERIRPCAHCDTPVRFIKGTWKVNGQRRKGWHWVNGQDGSHHRCSDFRRISTWSPSPAEDTRGAQRQNETAKAPPAKVTAAKAQAPLGKGRDWQPGPGDFNDALPI